MPRKIQSFVIESLKGYQERVDTQRQIFLERIEKWGVTEAIEQLGLKIVRDEYAARLMRPILGDIEKGGGEGIPVEALLTILQRQLGYYTEKVFNFYAPHSTDAYDRAHRVEQHDVTIRVIETLRGYMGAVDTFRQEQTPEGRIRRSGALLDAMDGNLDTLVAKAKGKKTRDQVVSIIQFTASVRSFVDGGYETMRDYRNVVIGGVETLIGEGGAMASLLGETWPTSASRQAAEGAKYSLEMIASIFEEIDAE